MCMITYLPPGVSVPWKEILSGATWNDDGHGWALAVDTGEIMTGHYMDKEYALDTFDLLRRAYPDAPAVFHSRWATHGTVGVENVHPFPVGRHAVVAHNGILPSIFHPRGKDTRSDTRVLADEHLMRWSPRGLWRKTERRYIGKVIGTSNKLCILSASPKLDRPRGFLVNANSGNWHRGAWFSNHDWDHDFAKWRHTPVTSGWWSSGSTGTATAKYVGGSSDDCKFCGSLDTVNRFSRACDMCDTCQDCAEVWADCMCWTPSTGKSAADSAEVFAEILCRECGDSDELCKCAHPDPVPVRALPAGQEHGHGSGIRHE